MQLNNIHFKVILNYLWIPELLLNVCHIQKSFKAEKKVNLAGAESLLCFVFYSWCYKNPDFISGCWICLLDEISFFPTFSNDFSDEMMFLLLSFYITCLLFFLLHISYFLLTPSTFICAYFSFFKLPPCSFLI